MQYKKPLFICILLIINQIYLQAKVQQVLSTETVTQQIANNFLINEQTSPPIRVNKKVGRFVSRNQAVGLSLGNIQTIVDEQDYNLVHVQELLPQGFIIISADNRMRSVLGFSFDSNFISPTISFFDQVIFSQKEIWVFKGRLVIT